MNLKMAIDSDCWAVSWGRKTDDLRKKKGEKILQLNGGIKIGLWFKKRAKTKRKKKVVKKDMEEDIFNK